MKHGLSGYIYRKCRCDVCRQARLDYVRARLTIDGPRNRRRSLAWDVTNRAHRKQYRETNRERILAYQRAWHAAHREEERAKGRARYAADPERFRAKTVSYLRANRDKVLAHISARRARIVGNGGSHTPKEWRDKLTLFANCCVYCGEAKPLERDHGVPLIRGGTDDIANVLPACRSCNSKKGTRTAHEYLGLAA